MDMYKLELVYKKRPFAVQYRKELAMESKTAHYHDVSDLRFLKEMGKLAPTEFSAWLNLDKVVAREDAAIPRKYRELIALGVTLTTQCPLLH